MSDTKYTVMELGTRIIIIGFFAIIAGVVVALLASALWVYHQYGMFAAAAMLLSLGIVLIVLGVVVWRAGLRTNDDVVPTA